MSNINQKHDLHQSAERMHQIKPSGLRKLFDLEHEIAQSATQKILSFGLGNLNIPVMPKIIHELKKALDDPITHRYSPNAGILELRSAIVEKYKNNYNLDYSPEQVIITSGCLEALFDTFLALINPGDEVLVQDPTLYFTGSSLWRKNKADSIKFSV
jgi:aspartate aminotransferase